MGRFLAFRKCWCHSYSIFFSNSLRMYVDIYYFCCCTFFSSWSGTSVAVTLILPISLSLRTSLPPSSVCLFLKARADWEGTLFETFADITGRVPVDVVAARCQSNTLSSCTHSRTDGIGLLTPQPLPLRQNVFFGGLNLNRLFIGKHTT